MQEAKDREIQFKKELKSFLEKWNTEIVLEDISINWNSEYVMKCYLDGIYKDGDCIAEFTEINLGTYVSGD